MISAIRKLRSQLRVCQPLGHYFPPSARNLAISTGCDFWRPWLIPSHLDEERRTGRPASCATASATKAFSAAGQLREFVSGTHTIIQGSTDADKTAEFEIDLNGKFTHTAADFML